MSTTVAQRRAYMRHLAEQDQISTAAMAYSRDIIAQLEAIEAENQTLTRIHLILPRNKAERTALELTTAALEIMLPGVTLVVEPVRNEFAAKGRRNGKAH